MGGGGGGSSYSNYTILSTFDGVNAGNGHAVIDWVVETRPFTHSRVPTASPSPATATLRPTSLLHNGSTTISLCEPYSALGTNSGVTNYKTCQIKLCPRDVVAVGVCSFGGSFLGDTYFSLVDPNGVTVSSNDDSCGVGSQLQFSVTADQTCGNYTIREGCHANYPCSGTVAVKIISHTSPPTNSPTVLPTQQPTFTWLVINPLAVNFQSIGSDQYYIVPDETYVLHVELFGAGGGKFGTIGGGSAGIGGYTQCTIDVTPGEKLIVIVGSAGRGDESKAYGGGGQGSVTRFYAGGGGGGGRSAIQRSFQDLVTAGGGGGCGTAYGGGGIAGNAGYPAGGSKVTGWDEKYGGGGGNQTFWYNGQTFDPTSKTQSAGTLYTGGQGLNYGAGGGGGYYGGGKF